ncbi:unnamed protein product [Brassica oleracea var. botrytis]
MILSQITVSRLNCGGCWVLMVVMIKVLVVEEAVRCYSCWIDIYIIVETIQTLTRYYFT